MRRKGCKEMPRWRRLFPAPFVHVPSEAELALDRERLARAIVMQHADGETLLCEGKFESTGDLLAEDDAG